MAALRRSEGLIDEPFYEPPECSKQGHGTTHWLEDHVQRAEEHHKACLVDQVAGNTDTK